MAQSLESYVAEATQAYAPASEAVQNQINALAGQLESANAIINKNYATQQGTLDRARNQAATTASLQAAGSGGSFGGAANLANRKYYNQTFVPAVTQLQTNQSNDLANAKAENDSSRLSLQSQLANLQAQANQSGLAQYYSDLEAERQREFQAEQAELERQNALAVARANNAASSSYYQYLMDAANAAKTGYSLSSTQNIYGGYDWKDNSTGNNVNAATVASAAGGDFNESLGNVLSAAGNDAYSQAVLNELRNGYRFAPNTSGQSTGNAWYDTLGIRKIYTGGGY